MCGWAWQKFAYLPSTTLHNSPQEGGKGRRGSRAKRCALGPPPEFAQHKKEKPGTQNNERKVCAKSQLCDTHIHTHTGKLKAQNASSEATYGGGTKLEVTSKAGNT